MNDYANDIERYRKGTMTNAERHAFEKKVLTDPFLAEALEGAELIAPDEFAEDIKALNQELLQPEEVQMTGLAPVADSRAGAFHPQKRNITAKPRQRASYWKSVGMVAAGLIIFLVAGYLIWQAANPEEKPDTLALKESVMEPATPGREAKQEDSLTISTVPAESSATTDNTLPPAEKPEGRTEVIAAKEPAELEEEKVEADQPIRSERLSREPLPQGEDIAVKSAENVSAAPSARNYSDQRKKQEITPALSASVIPATRIQGRVTSKVSGAALPGVNVIIKGASTGTVTDQRGMYYIESSAQGPTLAFSFFGFQVTEVPVDQRSVVDVALQQDDSQRSEVLIMGYSISAGKPYSAVASLASPETGMDAFRKYLETSQRYPEEARAKQVQGRVTVEFNVEADGRLTEMSVVEGIGSGCDEELIRLINKGPVWRPTLLDSQAVREKVRVRLKFELPK